MACKISKVFSCQQLKYSYIIRRKAQQIESPIKIWDSKLKPGKCEILKKCTSKKKIKK